MTLFTSSANADFFVNIRNGYTVNNTDTFITENGTIYDADYGHTWRVNLSLGYKPGFCRKYNCKIGIHHESSPLSGSIVNDDYEYTTEQIFFEVEWSFKFLK